MKIVCAVWAQHRAQYAQLEQWMLQHAEVEEQFGFVRCHMEQFDASPAERNGFVQCAVVLDGHEKTEAIMSYYKDQKLKVAKVEVAPEKPVEKHEKPKKGL